MQNNNILVNRVSNDKKTNNIGYKIVDICKNNNLLILNGRFSQDAEKGKFTFRDQSVIDYTISSNKGFQILTYFEIEDLDRIYSDGHALLQMNLTLKPTDVIKTNEIRDESRADQNYIKTYKCDQQKLPQFKDNIDPTKIEKLKRYLDTIGPNVTQTGMNEITSKLCDLFEESAEKTFEPIKPKASQLAATGKTHKPWFGFNCKKSRNLYTKARKRYQLNKTSENKSTLIKASKHYKQTMNRHINKYKKDQQMKLRKMHKKSPKEYWKYLNSLNKRTTTKTPSIESFLDFFKELNSCEHNTEDNKLDEVLSKIDMEDDNNILNTPITADEILKCILKLKNSKAPGSDRILNDYIKSTKEQFLPIYVRLFNIVLTTGIIPEKWVEGLIMPIYKNKGDFLNPENYRPITLLSCLGKLFTAVLNERLSNYLDENAILFENQAGFRRNYSTSDHIFVLHSLFELLKLQKKKLFCAFVDFSKAFDSVWRVGLWNKLLNDGINGKFFKVIFNLYQNIKSCITLNSSNSAFFESFIGLRQGENLSPVLFSIFLNDLELYLQAKNHTGVEFELEYDDMFFYFKFLVLLYADDTAIICDRPDEFQTSLNNFVSYCKIWKLNINYDKTKIVIFGARKTDVYCFTMEETIIEIVKSYKYLGVLMSSNGSFLNARKAIHERANKAMHLLYKRIYNLNLPLDLQLKLFDSTILPIITYGCDIWGYENLELFERIHNQFLRTITKCRKSTPMYMLYGELGRYPIAITIKTRAISFWARIIHRNSDKFVNIIYKKLIQVGEQKFKWTRNIKTILQEIGRNDIWINQKEHIPNNIKQLVRKTLIDQFLQKWHNSLEGSSKGLNYKLLKHEHKFEEYLTLLPPSKYIPLIKFRTANHFLPVETLRWQGIHISERKCMLCDEQDTADELHYLLKCKHFEQQRKLYIKPYYYKRPNILKFKDLFSSKSPAKLSKLSKFVSIIMKEFKRA